MAQPSVDTTYVEGDSSFEAISPLTGPSFLSAMPRHNSFESDPTIPGAGGPIGAPVLFAEATGKAALARALRAEIEATKKRSEDLEAALSVTLAEIKFAPTPPEEPQQLYQPLGEAEQISQQKTDDGFARVGAAEGGALLTTITEVCSSIPDFFLIEVCVVWFVWCVRVCGPPKPCPVQVDDNSMSASIATFISPVSLATTSLVSQNEAVGA